MLIINIALRIFPIPIIELMAIFIRFEQDEPALFGLSYRTKFDVEHGCGIKLKGNNQQFEIVEIGCADVAFC